MTTLTTAALWTHLDDVVESFDAKNLEVPPVFQFDLHHNNNNANSTSDFSPFLDLVLQRGATVAADSAQQRRRQHVDFTTAEEAENDDDELDTTIWTASIRAAAAAAAANNNNSSTTSQQSTNAADNNEATWSMCLPPGTARRRFREIASHVIRQLKRLRESQELATLTDEELNIVREQLSIPIGPARFFGLLRRCHGARRVTLLRQLLRIVAACAVAGFVLGRTSPATSALCPDGLSLFVSLLRLYHCDSSIADCCSALVVMCLYRSVPLSSHDGRVLVALAGKNNNNNSNTSTVSMQERDSSFVINAVFSVAGEGDKKLAHPKSSNGKKSTAAAATISLHRTLRILTEWLRVDAVQATSCLVTNSALSTQLVQGLSAALELKTDATATAVTAAAQSVVADSAWALVETFANSAVASAFVEQATPLLESLVTTMLSRSGSFAASSSATEGAETIAQRYLDAVAAVERVVVQNNSSNISKFKNANGLTGAVRLLSDIAVQLRSGGNTQEDDAETIKMFERFATTVLENISLDNSSDHDDANIELLSSALQSAFVGPAFLLGADGGGGGRAATVYERIRHVVYRSTAFVFQMLRQSEDEITSSALGAAACRALEAVALSSTTSTPATTLNPFEFLDLIGIVCAAAANTTPSAKRSSIECILRSCSPRTAPRIPQQAIAAALEQTTRMIQRSSQLLDDQSLIDLIVLAAGVGASRGCESAARELLTVLHDQLTPNNTINTTVVFLRQAEKALASSNAGDAIWCDSHVAFLLERALIGFPGQQQQQQQQHIEIVNCIVRILLITACQGTGAFRSSFHLACRLLQNVLAQNSGAIFSNSNSSDKTGTTTTATLLAELVRFSSQRTCNVAEVLLSVNSSNNNEDKAPANWIELTTDALSLGDNDHGGHFLTLLGDVLVETEQQPFFVDLVSCTAQALVQFHKTQGHEKLKSLIVASGSAGTGPLLLRGDTARLLRYFSFCSSPICVAAAELIKPFCCVVDAEKTAKQEQEQKRDETEKQQQERAQLLERLDGECLAVAQAMLSDEQEERSSVYLAAMHELRAVCLSLHRRAEVDDNTTGAAAGSKLVHRLRDATSTSSVNNVDKGKAEVAESDDNDDAELKQEDTQERQKEQEQQADRDGDDEAEPDTEEQQLAVHHAIDESAIPVVNEHEDEAKEEQQREQQQQQPAQNEQEVVAAAETTAQKNSKLPAGSGIAAIRSWQEDVSASRASHQQQQDQEQDNNNHSHQQQQFTNTFAEDEISMIQADTLQSQRGALHHERVAMQKERIETRQLIKTLHSALAKLNETLETHSAEHYHSLRFGDKTRMLEEEQRLLHSSRSKTAATEMRILRSLLARRSAALIELDAALDMQSAMQQPMKTLVYAVNSRCQMQAEEIDRLQRKLKETETVSAQRSARTDELRLQENDEMQRRIAALELELQRWRNSNNKNAHSSQQHNSVSASRIASASATARGNRAQTVNTIAEDEEL